MVEYIELPLISKYYCYNTLNRLHFSFPNWTGGLKCYDRDILTPPPLFNCFLRGDSYYYGCNILNPLLISNSNWRGGSKYHGRDILPPPFQFTILIKERVQNIMEAIYSTPSILRF